MPRDEERSLRRSVSWRTGAAITLALILLTLSAGAAQAKVVVLGGKPYGVAPTPKSTTLSATLGRAGPLSSRRAVPFTVGGPQPLLEYHGGPLMLSSKLYLIFWGPENSFPTNYTTPIIQYATDLHADAALTTNEFSVDEQYANTFKEHITGKVEFKSNEDVVFDPSAYPSLESSGGCTKAPCVTDTQIRAEILKEIEAKAWPTDTATKPEAQYLVYTPEGVASCIEPGVCNFSAEGFCAYHDQIKGIAPSNHVATYSDLPYMSECDSGQAPSGVGGNQDADGTLDSEIHEIVESATDPNVQNGYFDEEGQEIADKCTYPILEEQPEIYGAPLGGSLAAFAAFNQLIGTHTYYTQQIWSNEHPQTPASSEPAGCVARIGPTPSFTGSATAKTGQIVNFDGSGSYDISHPLTTYEWRYGDGSPLDTTSGATAKHVYTTLGTYQVTLTVSDGAGPTDASTQTQPIAVTGSTIAAPTASITSPADSQTFTLGQSVPTSFSCKEATEGPGIESCKDSNGATNPGTLDTSTLGPHDYTVTALSVDQLSGTAQIEYTVVNPSGGSGGGGTGGGSTGANSQSSGAPGNSGPPPTTTAPTGTSSKAGAANKLKRALRACRKQPKKKRARCIAAAKKRFGPHKKKRK